MDPLWDVKGGVHFPYYGSNISTNEILGASLKTLFSKRPPPPPDTSALVPVRGQQVVEEFYSRGKQLRVTILRDEQGIFRVRSFRWCIEDWKVAGRAFWLQADAMNTMTDTLEDARRLAGEYLAGIK